MGVCEPTCEHALPPCNTGPAGESPSTRTIVAAPVPAPAPAPATAPARAYTHRRRRWRPCPRPCPRPHAGTGDPICQRRRRLTHLCAYVQHSNDPRACSLAAPNVGALMSCRATGAPSPMRVLESAAARHTWGAWIGDGGLCVLVCVVTIRRSRRGAAMINRTHIRSLFPWPRIARTAMASSMACRGRLLANSDGHWLRP